ncbi:MAG: hypothetical protein HN564_04300, partial [Flavobacteriales bacterium]|nr:hypothetical protein [Flavobacteriales bacterium]
MNYDEWNILMTEWNNFLNENISIPDDVEMKSYVEKLNKKTLDFKNSMTKESYEYYVFQSDLLYQQLENIVYHDDKISLIGDGESRSGYSFKDKPWVLKLAKSVNGSKYNKEELKIYQRKHGSNTSKFFIKLYYWDEINEYPWWVISEKVKPLSRIEDITTLKNVFPTFWNVLDLGDKNRAKSSSESFKDFIVSTIMLCIYNTRLPEIKKQTYRKDDEEKYREMIMFNRNSLENQGKDVSSRKLKKVTSNFDNSGNDSGKLDKILPKINNVMFHDAARNFANVKDIEDVVFYEDFEILSKAF